MVATGVDNVEQESDFQRIIQKFTTVGTLIKSRLLNQTEDFVVQQAWRVASGTQSR